MYQDRLRSIFAAVVKMPEARVRVNAHVMDELGADSLQFLDYVRTVEKELGIKLKGSESEQFSTIQRAAAFLEVLQDAAFELEHVAEDDVVLGFGWAILGGDYQMAELGCISVSELLACGVELDLHFAPKTLGQVRLEHLGRINHGNASIQALMRDTPRVVAGRITYSIR